jgi:hypothetical protein
VICSKYSSRAIFLLAFLPLTLPAQQVQENVVPLKNWSSPLYWQPNQAEREAAAKASPKAAKPSPSNAAPQIVLPGAVSADALIFVAITPCRLVDTRGAADDFDGELVPFAGPSIPGGTTVTFPVQSTAEAVANMSPAPCGLTPPIAEAYSFNLTVIPHAGGSVGYVTLWPYGVTLPPVVATLTDEQGLVVSNAAIIAAGPDANGSVSLYNSGPATIDVVIDMNGYFTAPTDLNGNTALGAGALASDGSGTDNTATGADALQNNLGSYDTAIGYQALQTNTGSLNTAIGSGALANNAGDANTATGVLALSSNGGNFNTADGAQALASNTVGTGNSATGYQALQYNTVSYNTANGVAALSSNTVGGYNTASGSYALSSNIGGPYNTASGYNALAGNTSGGNNTAFGESALLNNTGGANNIAVGYGAGINQYTGNSDSIYIGSAGTPTDTAGSISIGTQSTEATGTITIGAAQAGSTSIAGISGGVPNATNQPVCVDSSGVLGTMGCNIALTTSPSSLRFKDQIADMGPSSDKLLQLRPVTFLYKPEYDDGSHALQYGLIAEEVAKLYPEMVGYDKDGQPSSVKYQSLAPMLLNELQKQAEQNRQQTKQIHSLEDRLTALEAGPVR